MQTCRYEAIFTTPDHNASCWLYTDFDRQSINVLCVYSKQMASSRKFVVWKWAPLLLSVEWTTLIRCSLKTHHPPNELCEIALCIRTRRSGRMRTKPRGKEAEIINYTLSRQNRAELPARKYRTTNTTTRAVAVVWRAYKFPVFMLSTYACFAAAAAAGRCGDPPSRQTHAHFARACFRDGGDSIEHSCALVHARVSK